MTFIINSSRFGGGGGGGGGTLAAAVGSKLYLYYRVGAGLYTDAGSTPAVSNGDLIYRWADASGNGRHAEQTTSGNRPTLSTGTQHVSTNTVHCSAATGGSEQWLALPDLTALTDATVLAVLKTDSDPAVADARTGLWRMGVASDSTHYPWRGDGKVYDSAGTDTRTSFTPAINLASSFRSYVTEAKAAAYTRYLNGTLVYGPTAHSIHLPVNPVIGASGTGFGLFYFMDGNYAAFAICSPSLDATELSNAVTALMTTTG